MKPEMYSYQEKPNYKADYTDFIPKSIIDPLENWKYE